MTNVNPSTTKSQLAAEPGPAQPQLVAVFVVVVKNTIDRVDRYVLDGKLEKDSYL